MSQKPIAMEQIKQILQLRTDGIAIREMARRIGISRNSVRKYLSLLEDSVGELTNKQLADGTYLNDSPRQDTVRLEQLVRHFSSTWSELEKTGVTRQLLWQEYLGQHPDGYGYSQYCYHLSRYVKRQDVTMHLGYCAADVIMIDFDGKKQHYIRPTLINKVSFKVHGE